MKEILIFQFALEIDGMTSTPGSSRIGLCGDETLLVFDVEELHEAGINLSRELAGTVIGDRPLAVSPFNLSRTRILTPSMEPCDTWCVNPTDLQFLVLQDRTVFVFSSDDGSLAGRQQIPGLPECAVASSISDDGRFLVLTATESSDPDFEVKTVVHVDLISEEVLDVEEVQSYEDLVPVWSVELGGCLIFGEGESGFRSWMPNSLTCEVHEYPAYPGFTRIGVDPDPFGRFVTQILFNETDNRFAFARGVMTVSGVTWERCSALPAGEYEDFRWHPNLDVFLTNRFTEDGVAMTIIDPAGEILSAFEVPESCTGTHLAWSGCGRLAISAGVEFVAVVSDPLRNHKDALMPGGRSE